MTNKIQRGAGRAKTLKPTEPFTPTTRADEVLLALANYIDEHGYAPSLENLCALTGIRAKSNVQYHLMVLERSGLVSRSPRIMRSLVVTETGRVRARWLKTQVITYGA